MVSSINTALSGLNAASKRLAVSSNNIANQNSTKSLENGQTVDKPYVPQRVEQISLENGGVKTVVKDVDPATVTQFDPDNPDADANGGIQVPNVSLESEIINQKIATYDYKANLKTLKVQDDLLKSLLDIQT